MDNLIFYNLCEVQVKFKILYLCSFSSEKSKILLEDNKPILIRVFLKILSLIALKEVLPGKFRHRLIFNYFKKLLWEDNTSSVIENNILFLDPTYLSTLGISYIYNFPSQGLHL